MFEATAVIQNAHGIHCRPSAVILKAVGAYPGTIRVQAAAGDCDLRSVLGLISLGLECGASVHIQVQGPDEARMGRRLVELFETAFDFPPLPESERQRSLRRLLVDAPPAPPPA